MSVEGRMGREYGNGKYKDGISLKQLRTSKKLVWRKQSKKREK